MKTTGLTEWVKKRDKFECEDVPWNALSFPCCACQHKIRPYNSGPCRTCDHNLSADPAETNQ